jgi:hypothetical protein
MKSRGTKGVPTGEIRVVTAAGNFTMGSEGTLVVNKGTGAATAVTLAANPDRGAVVIVKDGKGDAATNNITVTPAGGKTIDGAANKVISANYGVLRLQYNGTEWGTI